MEKTTAPTDKPKTETVKQDAAAKQELQQVLYIGPNSLREGLKFNQIFKQRPDEKKKKLKDKYPLVGLLFVKISKISEGIAQTKQAGTSLNIAYNQVKEGK